MLHLLFFLAFATFTDQPKYAIQITVDNIKTKEGQVIISLYDSEKGFPYEPEKYFYLPKESLKDGRAVFTIEIDKPGDYALTVVDDVNENGDMDKNFVGIPKEGFAFSKNAKPRGMRPPAFNDAKFTVREKQTALKVVLKYF
ncbi:MAG: DUF2141 domain-containing protein [Cryomorphaceae bacterium]|nr:DUF2141 domain-containing protein [Cryomorphaceae bacterium]